MWALLILICGGAFLSIPIEDYAMIGDCHTAALVSKQGSIDWLCLPNFDSPACFAALLGTAEHGRWSISPAEPLRSIRRSYRDGSLILETTFETESGSATLIDCMIPRTGMPELLREVFRAAGGTHDDWPTYDRVMAEERRAAVLISPERVYPNA